MFNLHTDCEQLTRTLVVATCVPIKSMLQISRLRQGTECADRNLHNWRRPVGSGRRQLCRFLSAHSVPCRKRLICNIDLIGTHVATTRVRVNCSQSVWRLNMFKKRHIAMAVAGLCAAQVGVASAWDDDAALLSDNSSTSSQQLTVFNPDGSSYAIAPVDIQVATIEPVIVA